jgi:hypothetical protein
MSRQLWRTLLVYFFVLFVIVLVGLIIFDT